MGNDYYVCPEIVDTRQTVETHCDVTGNNEESSEEAGTSYRYHVTEQDHDQCRGNDNCPHLFTDDLDTRNSEEHGGHSSLQVPGIIGFERIKARVIGVTKSLKGLERANKQKLTRRSEVDKDNESDLSQEDKA